MNKYMARIPCAKKLSWFKWRSSSLCTIVLIYLGSNLPKTSQATSETLQRNVCMTEKCVQSAASILEKIDKTVDPCEDFYKFACGNYMKNAIIQEDQVTVSQFSTISDKMELQLMSLFEKPISDNDPKFSKLVKTIYSSCMNISKIEQGLSYVKAEFKKFGGWPVVEPSWDEKFFDWINLQHRFKKDGWEATFFFDMYVGTNLKNSTESIFTLSQPQYPDIDLKKGLNDTMVQAMYDYHIELAVLFGADRANAIGDMKEVINFEIDLAKLKVSDEERRNQQLEHNPTTIRNLQWTFKSLPWLKLINNYLSPIEMLRYDDIVNVATPQFFKDFDKLWPKVAKRTLANYMFSKVLKRVVDYLPEDFKRKEHQFVKTVYGRKDLMPRWKRCVSEANTLHIAVSSIHIKNLVSNSTKHKVKELVRYIFTAFNDRLKIVEWMDQKTKGHAIDKSENMDFIVAYPEKILDDQKVEGYYRELELDADDHFLKIGLNLSKFGHVKNVQTLRDDDINWISHASTYLANAFYSIILNAIELPAAILQDHFYDPDRPQYMNFGAIGQVISHEISHGFDNVGRQHDKEGNVTDWWDSETDRIYLTRSQCFVEQYGNCTVPEIGMNLNGVNTLGENIADNGAIRIAYSAYLKWVESNAPEALLPGLPYTAVQLFWITAATNWCQRSTKEYLKYLVISGTHSPPNFRVLMPFKNSDHFGKDFNCPIGSPMNPEYKCSLW